MSSRHPPNIWERGAVQRGPVGAAALSLIHTAVMPVQMDADKPMSPERRLVLAVLEAALLDYRNGYSRARQGCDRSQVVQRVAQLHDEVREWFASDSTIGPFAFENVCDTLGLCASKIRQQLAMLPMALVPPRRMVRATGPPTKVTPITARIFKWSPRGRHLRMGAGQ